VTFSFIEEPPQGWVLDRVECENLSGNIIVENVEEGIILECVNPDQESGLCTFFNRRSAENIPTLSQWGLIAAAVGLGLIGFIAYRRRAIKG
jgi:hypothetical protein